MTIKELKERIHDMPDHMEVSLLHNEDNSIGLYAFEIKDAQVQMHEIETFQPHATLKMGKEN